MQREWLGKNAACWTCSVVEELSPRLPLMSSLVDQLSSSNPDVRHAAIIAVAGTDSLAVVEVLAARLADVSCPEPERQLAAEALAKCQLPEVAAMLLPKLTSEAAFTRTMAAMGLGCQQTREVVLALIRALTDSVNTVRNWAERSLLGMGAAVQQHGVEALIGMLTHEAKLSRSPAARLLGLTHDRRALGPLVSMAEGDEDWLARMGAIKALGDLGLADALPVILKSLQSDPKNRVRAAAAEAIGKLRPEQAESILRSVLETDEDEGVQKMTGEALRSLGFEVADINDDGWE